jgi:hypothetical protein
MWQNLQDKNYVKIGNKLSQSFSYNKLFTLLSFIVEILLILFNNVKIINYLLFLVLFLVLLFLCYWSKIGSS